MASNPYSLNNAGGASLLNSNKSYNLNAGTNYNINNQGTTNYLKTNPSTPVTIGWAGSSVPKAATPAPPPAYSNPALDALLAQIRAQTAAANAPLPVFDTAANRAKAQAQAGSSVNPVYQDMLNNFLRNQATKTAQQKAQAETNKGTIATGLNQSLEDTAIGRTRTTEDTTNAMGDIQFGENTYQRQEGRQFDAARMALLENIADSGLTESGIGAGRVANAVTDRNIASEARTKEFDTARRDTQLNFSRKLADFDTADVRAKGSAESSNKQVDFDLQSYLDNTANAESDYRYQNEQERQAAIDSAAKANYSSYVSDAIAALAQKGTNASVLARFGQAYM